MTHNSSKSWHFKSWNQQIQNRNSPDGKKKNNVVTVCHCKYREMTASLTFPNPYISPSYKWWAIRETADLDDCLYYKKHLVLPFCLFWPMPDLRRLVSLDNLTTRVLMVADGAGILGKCVKLVFTSGPSLLSTVLWSFCSLLSAALYTPVSLSLTLPSYIQRSIPPATPSLFSLSLSPPLHPCARKKGSVVK